MEEKKIVIPSKKLTKEEKKMRDSLVKETMRGIFYAFTLPQDFKDKIQETAESMKPFLISDNQIERSMAQVICNRCIDTLKITQFTK